MTGKKSKSTDSREAQNETSEDVEPTIPVLILAEDAIDDAESSGFNPYDTAVLKTISKDKFKP